MGHKELDQMEWIKSPSGKTARPADALDIGSNHWVLKLYKDEKWVAIYDYHLKPDGEFCAGYVPFNVPEQTSKTTWDVHSLEPLHLEPSLLCGCGDHGWIRDGKWVQA